MTDEELVIKTIDGDLTAYDELVRRYERKLLRYAGGLVKNGCEQDVVQEAFIKAYKNLKSFDTKKKFSSWMYRIAHNEAINQIKKNSRTINVGIREWFEEKITVSESSEDELVKKEELGELKEKIDKLSINYKVVLKLYYFEEKSYSEISDILRIPVSTVGVRIKRAREKLKNEYQK